MSGGVQQHISDVRLSINVRNNINQFLDFTVGGAKKKLPNNTSGQVTFRERRLFGKSDINLFQNLCRYQLYIRFALLLVVIFLPNMSFI